MKKTGHKKRFKSCLNIILAAVLAVCSFSVTFVNVAPNSASQVAAATNYTLDQLYTLIEQYESKMDGTTVYTNMADAYYAYIAACEAYYENLYGYEYDDGTTTHDFEQSEINDAYTNLTDKMSAMAAFDGYVGEATSAADGSYGTSSNPLMTTSLGYTYSISTFGQNSSTAMYDELSGVLYTYGVGTASGHYGPNLNASGSGTRVRGEGMNTGLRYGSIVFLYTGTGNATSTNAYQQTTTYAAPINMYINSNGTAQLGFLDIAVQTSGYTMNDDAFSLNRAWHGYYKTTSKYNTVYYEGNSSLEKYKNFAQHYSNLSTSYLSMASNSVPVYYTNTLYYTGMPSTKTTTNTTTIVANSSTSGNDYAYSYYALDYIYYRYYSSTSNGYTRYCVANPVISGTSGSINHQQSSSYTDLLTAYSNGNYNTSSSNVDMASNCQPGGAANSYIYVINYENVLQSLEQYKSYLKMVDADSNTYYRQNQGSAMSILLTAFDTLTKDDPNTQFASATTSTDIATLVSTVSSTLSSEVTAISEAASNLSSNYDRIESGWKYYIMRQTGDDPLDFTLDGSFVTSGKVMDNYNDSNNSETTGTNYPKGTVGIVTPNWQFSQKSVPTGYSYSHLATQAYYDQVASHTLTSATFSGLNSYSKASVPTNQNTTVFQGTVWSSKNAVAYVFYTANNINLTVKYQDTSGNTLKTESKVIGCPNLTYTVPYSFISVDGVKYVRTETGISTTYANQTLVDNSENPLDTDVTHTWVASSAAASTAYVTDAINNTASTSYTTTVEYKAVEVTVNYGAYTVTTTGGAISGEADGVTAGSVAPTSETVTMSSAVAGSTASLTNNDSESYRFLGWYKLDAAATSCADFSGLTPVSTDLVYTPDLSNDVESWTDGQQYYYCALFAPVEPENVSYNLTVNLGDSLPDGEAFIVTITDSENTVYTAAAVAGADGTAQVTFIAPQGTYTAAVSAAWAWNYDISDSTKQVNLIADQEVSFTLSAKDSAVKSDSAIAQNNFSATA